MAAAVLALARVRTADIFLTPIFWTGYLLLIDSAVLSLRGRSLLRDARGAFAWMALLSVGLWLVFEAYNLRLQNWRYEGLPASTALRCFGYLWSFAAIWPVVLETAEFLLAAQRGEGPTASRGEKRPAEAAADAGPEGAGDEPRRIESGGESRDGAKLRAMDTVLIAVGAAGVIVPVAVPPRWGAYLFGMVWVGFALLLDPLNCRAGRSSILGDFRRGERRRLVALLEAGLVCGFFWEFWNYWAVAKWVYIFPILQHVKIFEMPVAGYLGFPAFAVEVFAMYVYVSGRLGLPYHEVG